MTISPDELEALRRNSGIALSSDGVWRYRDARVPHPRVQELFHRGLELRADGQIILNVGKYWCYVTCESVARFVDGITLRPAEGTFSARLKGGFKVVAERPPRIAFDPDSRLFVWLPGQPVAVLTQQAHNAIIGHMDVSDQGQLELALGRVSWPVASLSATPEPDATFAGLVTE